MWRLMLLSVVLTSTCHTGEIPLKEIWALGMPGTKNVRDLEKDLWEQNTSRDFMKQSLCIKAQKLLMKRLKPDEQAPPAFFVEGTGLDALRQLVNQLEKYEKSEGEHPAVAKVPAHKELSLVFFSYGGGRYIHLDSVKQGGNRIGIDYHEVAHQSKDVTSHFAIIPVGKLEPGPGKVLIDQLPPVHQEGARVTVLKDSYKTVCSPFTFEVEEHEGECTATIRGFGLGN